MFKVFSGNPAKESQLSVIALRNNNQRFARNRISGMHIELVILG